MMFTITDAIEDVFVSYESKNKSAKTTKNLKNRLAIFNRYMNDSHRVDRVHLLRSGHLQGYLQFLSAQTGRDGNPWTPKYINVHLWALRALLNHLKKYNHIALDLAQYVEDIDTPKTLPRHVMSHDQVVLFISQIDKSTDIGYRNYVIFNLLANSGVRVDEFSQLDLSDVNLKERTLFIRYGKFSKQRLVTFSESCEKLLRNYLSAIRPTWRGANDSNALFLGALGLRFGVKGIEMTMRKYIDAAGLSRKFTPHSLRKYVVTALANADANPYHIKELMGWDSLKPLRSYAKLNTADLRKTMMKCHPLEQKTN